ncbi:MAG: hypothetical protein E7194_02540 [Erysipelotrichaceae bacterium]|nr:hypothetical protein [Erysipelotrichaceae bacterium]
MDILEQFTDELHEWSLTGREPVSASIDLRYMLDLQEARLKEQNILKEEEYIHVKDEIRGSLPRKGNGYTSKIIYREARQNLTYRRGDKVLRKYSRPVNLYVSVLDREDASRDTCTCPNCGHTMTAEEARDGCPYCGTHCEMEEVYPCAVSYYTVPSIVERGTLMENIKKELMISGVLCGLAVAVICFIAWNELPLLYRIPAALFMGTLYGGVFAFCWYMIRSLILLGKVFFAAGRSFSMLKGLNSRKKMTEFMQVYDPFFSYEAFEGRILSLLRSAAFENDRDFLAVWEGDGDLSFLDTVLDMQYRGALYIRRCEKNGEMLRVEGTAFMTDTYAGRSFKEIDEQFRFIAEKEISADYNPAFTLLRASCEGCGGSFDAVHQKCCPYCGRKYELKKKDWVLTDLKRR